MVKIDPNPVIRLICRLIVPPTKNKHDRGKKTILTSYSGLRSRCGSKHSKLIFTSKPPEK